MSKADTAAHMDDTNNDTANTAAAAAGSAAAPAAAAHDTAAALTIGTRVELKKWSAVSLWSWDIEVDNCAICRNLVMEFCIECQANRGGSIGAAGGGGSGHNDDCTVAWGVCNHAFHFHCISRWLRTRPSCPLDNQDWEFQKYGNSTAGQ